MKTWATALIFPLYSLKFLQVHASPTWPSSYDELEDLMVLNDGYRSRGFADPVSPCVEKTPGKVAAAAVLRTAFHDMAPANAATGIGGFDASIGFELQAPYTTSNRGGIFNYTINQIAPFYNSRASMADLLALMTYSSVRSCGGPSIPIKTGRIDATQAGPQGVPNFLGSRQEFIDDFARMGFSPAEMIQMVACGHTLGAVHSDTFPEIVPPNTTPNGAATFDSTPAAFDNKCVTSYIDGTTQDPLVVGQNQAARSGAAIFGADNNATMKTMADPTTFQNTCQSILQRMIERVPSGVKLTEAIVPYDVKPGVLSLSMGNSNRTMTFSGEIRIRTNTMPAASIAKVQLKGKDRNGQSSCGSCIIDTTVVGTATGFDDSFTFYSFSEQIDARTSISKFNVLVTLTSGEVRTFDNNGQGFPIQDSLAVQSQYSTLSQTVDSAGNQKLNIVAAVRGASAQNVIMTVALVNPQVFNTLPTVNKIPVTMSAIPNSVTCGGFYNLYQATFDVPTAQVNSTKFDISATLADGSQALSTFNSITDLLSTATTIPTTCSSQNNFVNGGAIEAMGALTRRVRSRGRRAIVREE